MDYTIVLSWLCVVPKTRANTQTRTHTSLCETQHTKRNATTTKTTITIFILLHTLILATPTFDKRQAISNIYGARSSSTRCCVWSVRAWWWWCACEAPLLLSLLCTAFGSSIDVGRLGFGFHCDYGRFHFAFLDEWRGAAVRSACCSYIWFPDPTHKRMRDHSCVCKAQNELCVVCECDRNGAIGVRCVWKGRGRHKPVCYEMCSIIKKIAVFTSQPVHSVVHAWMCVCECVCRSYVCTSAMPIFTRYEYLMSVTAEFTFVWG